MPYEWHKLSDFWSMLKTHQDYEFSLLDHEQALENALRSREIPIRGKERGWKRYSSEFSRIESQLSNWSRICVWGNRVETQEGWGASIFEDVEVEANAATRWLAQNAIESGRAPPNIKIPPPAAKAIADLKHYLSTRPDSPVQIRREFFDQVRAGGIPELGNRFKSLSYRQFGGIWTECAPKEWTKAGFRPGRQRKIKSPR
jgi:hypothetical protein